MARRSPRLPAAMALLWTLWLAVVCGPAALHAQPSASSSLPAPAPAPAAQPARWAIAASLVHSLDPTAALSVERSVGALLLRADLRFGLESMPAPLVARRTLGAGVGAQWRLLGSGLSGIRVGALVGLRQIVVDANVPGPASRTEAVTLRGAAFASFAYALGLPGKAAAYAALDAGAQSATTLTVGPGSLAAGDRIRPLVDVRVGVAF